MYRSSTAALLPLQPHKAHLLDRFLNFTADIPRFISISNPIKVLQYANDLIVYIITDDVVCMRWASPKIKIPNNPFRFRLLD